ncbi:enoyl-CoA hydratase/isomerase family protein [Croceicoccus sp. F390]|uniref:3-hydroxyisobutyryl-CoA hydrolase n=1 Tax=Croceicoccus esteveae TaxID=3075597 RepID=A0ABU2ZFC5_9SPHN|nr:enoyl-CoA hydratase/isomerase family protein [Croceicoccus sp. F390]MDT0575305.1 enoyl-CoA hydratase/isomerase family protein [Croceicoccus sp. F390]
MTPDIHIHTHGAVGHLSLNRPKAIHALTLDMCRAMTVALQDWAKNDAVRAIILDHAEGRGFCAGGDITLLRRSALEDGGAEGRSFFAVEYRLNHLMFTYDKPIAAFMDGVTMGGGVGIALPSRYRIATERTRFAMPETGIGLICDVGGGWYLPRLPGRLGQFIGLTGARLDGAECLWAGIATHYMASDRLAEAKARIIADPDDIGAILDDCAQTAPPPRIAGNMEPINRLFAADEYETILDALTEDDGEWAQKELATLSSKSPTSCKAVLRQLQIGAEAADFAANMTMEYRAAGRILTRPDFAEGVRALLVDKDNDPHWQPATAAGVSTDDIEALFAPLPAQDEWKPL